MLLKAFKEADRSKLVSEDVNVGNLPAPVAPTSILERIRAKDKESKISPFVQFPQNVSKDNELRLAARKGSEISLETHAMQIRNPKS